MLSDPGDVIYTYSLYGINNIAFWILKTISPSQLALFGALSLQLTLTAYNIPCLRLTTYIAIWRPRLGTKCAESALFRQLFQLLDERRFVALLMRATLLVAINPTALVVAVPLIPLTL